MTCYPPTHTLTKSHQHADGHQEEGSQQGHQHPDGQVPAPTLALHHTLASHGCLTDHPPTTHTFTHCQFLSPGLPKSRAVCEHTSKCTRLESSRHIFYYYHTVSFFSVLGQSSLIIVLDCFLYWGLQLLLLCCRY